MEQQGMFNKGLWKMHVHVHVHVYLLAHEQEETSNSKKAHIGAVETQG